MAKNHQFSNPALKQKSTANTNFNLVHKTTNFNSIFDVQPLEQAEATVIETLLIESSNPDSHTESQVHKDISDLKSITAEIRAIGRQGILLMGERISKARELLKSYHNGTFTKWLDATFGSQKTGYNLLTYYDFYSALPEPSLKEKFRKLPQKVAYILASRKGDMKKKEEIVRCIGEQKPNDLLSLIQEKLPIKPNDKRSLKDGSLNRILKLKNELKMILHRKNHLSHEKTLVLVELRDMIENILSASQPKNERTKS